MKNIDKVEKFLVEEGIKVFDRIEEEKVGYIGFNLNGDLFRVELAGENITITDHQGECKVTVFDIEYFKEKIEKLKNGVPLFDTLL